MSKDRKFLNPSRVIYVPRGAAFVIDGLKIPDTITGYDSTAAGFAAVVTFFDDRGVNLHDCAGGTFDWATGIYTGIKTDSESLPDPRGNDQAGRKYFYQVRISATNQESWLINGGQVVLFNDENTYPAGGAVATSPYKQTNLYDDDGTLAADRTIDADGNDLTVDDVGTFSVVSGSATSGLSLGGSQMAIFGGAASIVGNSTNLDLETTSGKLRLKQDDTAAAEAGYRMTLADKTSGEFRYDEPEWESVGGVLRPKVRPSAFQASESADEVGVGGAPDSGAALTLHGIRKTNAGLLKQLDYVQGNTLLGGFHYAVIRIRVQSGRDLRCDVQSIQSISNRQPVNLTIGVRNSGTSYFTSATAYQALAPYVATKADGENFEILVDYSGGTPQISVLANYDISADDVTITLHQTEPAGYTELAVRNAFGFATIHNDLTVNGTPYANQTQFSLISMEETKDSIELSDVALNALVESLPAGRLHTYNGKLGTLAGLVTFGLTTGEACGAIQAAEAADPDDVDLLDALNIIQKTPIPVKAGTLDVAAADDDNTEIVQRESLNASFLDRLVDEWQMRREKRIKAVAADALAALDGATNVETRKAAVRMLFEAIAA